MHISCVRLKNIGLYAELEQSLTRGLVGVFGGNGSGKTTLVNSIYACLTNDFGRFDGVKADLVRDTAEDHEEAYIELEGEHDGVAFRLRRGLRPNRSALWISGEKEVTKSNEIDARLMRDLGVNRQMVDQFVFVDQWRIFDFLSHTPAVRAAAFKHLCGVDRMDAVYSALTGFVSQNQASNEVVDDSQELATQIAESKTRIKRLGVQRLALENKLLSENNLAKAREIIKKRDRYETLSGLLKQSVLQRDKNSQKLAQHLSSLQEAESAKQAAAAQLDALEAEAKEAQKSLDAYQQMQKLWERRENLVLKMKKLRKARRQLTAPQPFQHALSREEAQAKASEHSHRVSEAQKFLLNWRKAMSGRQAEDCVCPTCLQPVDEAFVAKQEAQANAPDPGFSAIVAAYSRAEQAQLAYQTQQANWRQAWRAAKEAFELYRNATPPASPEQAETILANFQELELAKKEAEQRYDALRLSHSTLEASVDVRKKEVEKLISQLELCRVSDALLEKAKTRLKEHTDSEALIPMLTENITSESDKLNRLRARLKQLRELLKTQQKKRKLIEAASRVRDVFHWSCLPQRVASHSLSSVVRHMNESLELFGSPFWVEAGDQLNFIVHFPGAPPRRAESLSGGQKCVLAVAFRAALNSLFRADIGMLFLDEPTAGLDQDNVRYLEQMLAKLAYEVRHRRQIVIITHEQGLRSAFDQVIELGASCKQ